MLAYILSSYRGPFPSGGGASVLWDHAGPRYRGDEGHCRFVRPGALWGWQGRVQGLGRFSEYGYFRGPQGLQGL